MLQLDTLSSSEVAVKRSTKGNIKVEDDLLNKYNSVREIFDSEKNNFKYCIRVDYKLNLEIDIENIKIESIKKLAYEIFKENHQVNIFMNQNNKILVNKSGISESIEKICNNYSQRNLLIEHLKIFSVLGIIIENARLVNQIKI